MRRAALAIVLATAATLGACATHTKGSWSCAIERGGACSSIADIDAQRGSANTRAAASQDDPIIAGAIPARLWGRGGWTAGPIAGAPARETEVTVKVAIAPWIDTAGDYHTGDEVFAVMRRGGWFMAPPPSERRVQLSATALHGTSPWTAGAEPAAVGAPAPTVDLAKFAPIAVSAPGAGHAAAAPGASVTPVKKAPS